MTDEVARMSESFIRSVAAECKCCLRANSGSCRNCYARTANMILREIVNPTVSPVVQTFSYHVRRQRIIECLKKLGRPALSTEIEIGGDMSVQLKHWTLKRMAELGDLEITKFSNTGRDRNYYALTARGRGARFERQPNTN